MRVLKKLYKKDRKTIMAASAFDDVIRTAPLMNFDTVEFHFGYGHSHIDDGTALLGLDEDDLSFGAEDRRLMKILIRFELYRALVKKSAAAPRLVEDILIGRAMARDGYAEDLTYMFYIFMLRHRVSDARSFLKHNVPWLTFFGVDRYYSEFFRQLSKSVIRAEYEAAAEKLFEALKRDLSDDENRKSASELLGDFNASD